MGYLNLYLIRFGCYVWYLWNINWVIMMWIKRDIYVYGLLLLVIDDLSLEGNMKYI